MTEMRVDEVAIPVDPASLPSPAPDSPLEALSWLGDTVEEVAEGLRARGIKGQLRIADACPLSNYLRTWYENPSIFSEITVMDDDKDYFFVAPTPDAAWMFIQLFDGGMFPDLIDNG